MGSINYPTTAKIYKILSAPSRVRVIKALDGKKTVIQIATELKMPYSYVSRILFSLAEQEFLTASMDGTHKKYRITSVRLKSALNAMSVGKPEIEEGEIADVPQREDSAS